MLRIFQMPLVVPLACEDALSPFRSKTLIWFQLILVMPVWWRTVNPNQLFSSEKPAELDLHFCKA